MSFAVAAEAYDRFMGRYSGPLTPLFADLAGVGAGRRVLRVLDVGCGPGALTAELIARLGAAAVTAVDPSESFAAAVHERHPEIEVHSAPAEHLPFGDAAFDACLAQLVVHFMADPLAGLREMARVTRPGGVVAACVWDHGEGSGPLSAFWSVARALDSGAAGEGLLPGSRRGELARLLAEAGLADVVETALAVEVTHPGFAEWWDPYTLGVGPAGAYVAGLAPDRRDALREECRRTLPPAPFTICGTAWAARGRVAPRHRRAVRP